MNWDNVVELMGTYSLPLQAVLRAFHVLSVDDGQVVIGAKHKFHLSQAKNNKRAVQRAISHVLGREVSVSIQKHAPEDLLMSDPVVRFAVEELGAEARLL